MLNFTLICHIHTFQSKNKNITKHLEFLAKQGIPGQNKEKQNNDKNLIHLPRQCLMQAVKALILLDFLEINQKFTPYLYLWKTGSE